MIAAGAIIVLVLAVFGWFQLRDRIANQGIQAAETCVEGQLTLPVTVDPDISTQVTDLAAEFTATRPVVRDHCVAVAVTAADSAQVAGALTAADPSWDQQTLGPAPALWIPRSSDTLVGLPAGTVAGTPRSIAQSPVVLASPIAVTSAMRDAGTGWADLPGLQGAPDGLDVLGLPGWGGLRLQLPIGPSSDSTAAALAAVAESTSGTPMTPEDVRRGSTVSAMSALGSTDHDRSAVVTDSTETALARLSADISPTADFHSVPTTEQQLAATFADSGISAYAPTGSAPIADYPAAILSGRWTDETLSRAAAQFVDFVGLPENRAHFTDAGFETADAPPDAPTTSADTARALIDAVRNPATPRRATILLDVSGSMDTVEGGRSRLQNTTAALRQQFEAVTDSSELGLWVYSNALDAQRPFREEVSTGPVSEALPSGTRRSQLSAALDALRPSTATSTYESVTATYIDAVENFAPGVPNSVILVTDGPNDDPSISSERFLSVLASSSKPDRPVSIDVVSIGTNSDIGTLQSMSDMTGGSVTTVNTSDGPELPDLLRKLLY